MAAPLSPHATSPLHCSSSPSSSHPQDVEHQQQPMAMAMAMDDPSPPSRIVSRRPIAFRTTRAPKRKICWAGVPEVKPDVQSTKKRKGSAASAKSADGGSFSAGEYPSFSKLMKNSHVSHPFQLGVPLDFCKSHLPHDVDFTLEDEHGQSYPVKYLGGSKRLGGGWNTFAKEHSLEVGDAAVFELTGPTKIKVHITKGNGIRTGDDSSKSTEGPDLTKASSSDDAHEEAVCDADGPNDLDTSVHLEG